MCGRFTSSTPPGQLAKYFGAHAPTEELIEAAKDRGGNFNVAPTQGVYTIYEDGGLRRLDTFHWGLVPFWAKDPKVGNRMINARSETLAEKNSYKRPFARKRCIVPADGYYEWEKRDGAKVPYFLHDGDGVLAMAGLYELWRDPTRAEDDENRWVWSVTVLTSPAADALGHIHDRSPVVLPPDLRSSWLDPAVTDLGDVRDLLAAIPEPRLEPYEVSTAVNSVKNNSPELLTPV